MNHEMRDAKPASLEDMDPADRARWLAKAGSAVVADAWAAFKASKGG